MSAYPPSLESVAELETLQRLMAGLLMRPLNKHDHMQRKAADGQQTAKVVESFIKPNDRLSSFERLEIYNRQYWFRLLDCLYDDYPGLRSLLGERRFRQLCVRYLEQYPSESFTLRNLGSRLEEFLTNEPQMAGSRADMALDIARFEWAQTVAFDEARLPPLKGDDLLGADMNNLRLRLQPYLSLLELNYEVDVYFMAVRKDEASMRSEASNAREPGMKESTRRRVKLPKKNSIWLAVHRCDNELYFLRLEQEAYRLLNNIGEGMTVPEALEEALSNASPQEDWSAKVQSWFEQWTALGWFAKRPMKTLKPSSERISL